MVNKQKLQVAKNLLDEASEAFGKNHFGKINQARNIIDKILKEVD
jgi:hypothetical protein